jgi:hypothetical protein
LSFKQKEKLSMAVMVAHWTKAIAIASDISRDASRGARYHRCNVTMAST